MPLVWLGLVEGCECEGDCEVVRDVKVMARDVEMVVLVEQTGLRIWPCLSVEEVNVLGEIGVVEDV